LATGRIEIDNLNGGVAPYLFKLNNRTTTDSTSLTGLKEDTYTLIAEDANGCVEEETSVLVSAIIPVVELGGPIRLELADEIDLIPKVTSGVELATWRDNSGLSCYDCLSPVASPTNNTTFFITATSEDNCSVTDSVFVQVIKVRDVFVPTAFSPNQDGINDRLTVFTGPEANNVASLKIFSRWGEQLFEQTRFSPNDLDAGWDGTHAGQLLDQGVYVWVAEIDFIDGERLIYSGDVALIK